jgi:hypothetical protein
MEDQETVIGIDLGTTYSCVGVWQNNTVVMVPNDRGQITTPSYVNFTDTGKRSVGSAAKNLAARYPSSTIYVSPTPPRELAAQLIYGREGAGVSYRLYLCASNRLPVSFARSIGCEAIHRSAIRG